MKKSVYEVVTEAIIAKLEAGVVPWVRPWKNGKQAGGARNWNTGKLYRGVNQLLLDWSGEWAIFDRVSVPPLSDYRCAEEYYCTLFHELVHSTGHESRLKREKGKAFGDKAYSKEELIAEVGAAMLCG